MKKISFQKFHGSGNDFIMIDNRNNHVSFGSSGEIERLCNRHFGIGADGLILVRTSAKANFTMDYYNADGNIGSMCGNGGRCAIVFASLLGMVNGNATFEAFDGMHEGRIIESKNKLYKVTLKMQDVLWHPANGDIILDTGSPHYIKVVDDVDKIDVVNEGKKIRYSEQYSRQGINVNFISNGDGVVKIRTYERGVENETLSCGTGTVAAAIAMNINGIENENIKVDLLSRGGRLSVSFKKAHNTFTDVWLTGPVEKVFEGSIDLKD